MAVKNFGNLSGNITSGRGFKITKRAVLKPLNILPLKKLKTKHLYKKSLRFLSNNPLALYVAGAAGAYFLGRFAIRYYKNHPEISEFFRANMDKIELRLKEFRGEKTPDESATHH